MDGRREKDRHDSDRRRHWVGLTSSAGFTLYSTAVTQSLYALSIFKHQYTRSNGQSTPVPDLRSASADSFDRRQRDTEILHETNFLNFGFIAKRSFHVISLII